VLFAIGSLSVGVNAGLLPSLFPSQTPDFFIIRSGAVIALRGESPYQPELVRALVAEQFPSDSQLIANSAFFLPPATLLLYAPLAALPYPAAKLVWALGLIVCAVAVLQVLRTFGTRWPSSPAEQFLPLILLLNYLTLAIVELGQTSFLFVGCAAAGQCFFERGLNAPRRHRLFECLGAFLWAVPFIKPHLALALLPLAWYLGGWRRVALILVFVAALNVLGCLMIGRSPLFLWDYVHYLGQTHKHVIFNRAEFNPTITSWNRLLFALGGPLVELTAVTTLAGYLVWFWLAACRCAFVGRPPSAAWAAAIAAVGGVLCSQVLIYELLLLAFAIPWIRGLFASDQRSRGWLATSLLCVQFIPVGGLAAHGINFHPALGVALLAALVLTGPVESDRPFPR
jgi:hypothetical protein